VKASAGELAARRREIKEFYLAGNDEKTTMMEFAERYQLSPSTIQHDLQIIYQELRAYARSSEIIEEHIGRYDYIYLVAMRKNDRKNALQALRQKEELLNLIQKPTANIINYQKNVSVTATLNEMTVEQLKQIAKIIDCELIIDDDDREKKI
jgi:predicted transcriptional regulator